MNRWLFAEVDLPIINKTKVIKWIETVPKTYWLQDDYRKCNSLPLMTKNGRVSKYDVENNSLSTNDFFWVEYVPDFIRQYFEKNVFIWTKIQSRIIIIKTMPKCQNLVHIDCSPSTFHTIQHKFRIVIQGTSDNLYFKTKNKKIWAPLTEKPFIIDGSWPHGMINHCEFPKYTICLGSPWTYSDYWPGLKPLIFKKSHELPESYQEYFNPKYEL